MAILISNYFASIIAIFVIVMTNTKISSIFIIILVVVAISLFDLILISLTELSVFKILIPANIFLLLNNTFMLITYLIHILLVQLLKWILCKLLRRFPLWRVKICGSTLIKKIVRLGMRVFQHTSVFAWNVLNWMSYIDISIQFLLKLLLEWLRLKRLTLALLLKLLFLLEIYRSLLLELRRFVYLLRLGVCIVILIKMGQWNRRCLTLLRRWLKGLLWRKQTKRKLIIIVCHLKPSRLVLILGIEWILCRWRKHQILLKSRIHHRDGEVRILGKVRHQF